MTSHISFSRRSGLRSFCRWAVGNQLKKNIQRALHLNKWEIVSSACDWRTVEEKSYADREKNTVHRLFSGWISC
jgi:hypothetical protein